MTCIVSNSSPTCFAIEARQMFDGARLRGPTRVEIINDRIVAVLEAASSLETTGVIRLAEDSILTPGFIDVQVNGGGGVLLNDDPSVKTIKRIAETHRHFGTTGLLPTLISDKAEKLIAVAKFAKEAINLPGVLGFHFEGPYLNPIRKGIHPAEYIRAPDAHSQEIISAFGRIGRSQVTLAPECVEADLIENFVAHGLRVSVGHSDASGPTVISAADRGLSGVTHLFNAMSQMSGRAPGVVGAALADDRLFAGIICDGQHVDNLSARVAFLAKGRDRLMLVTDAMPPVGTEQVEFMLHGRVISARKGRLTDDAGTLAGAHLTMIEAVRNAVQLMAIPLEHALTMASLTPARFLGLDRELGRIEKGYRANLVAVDASFLVTDTWIDGARNIAGASPNN